MLMRISNLIEAPLAALAGFGVALEVGYLLLKCFFNAMRFGSHHHGSRNDPANS